jgi:hypothetical protein
MLSVTVGQHPRAVRRQAHWHPPHRLNFHLDSCVTDD